MYKFFYIPGVAGFLPSTLSSCHLLIASVMNYFFPKPLKYSSFSDYTTFLTTNQNGRSPRKSPELRVVGDIYMISVYLALNLPVFFQSFIRTSPNKREWVQFRSIKEKGRWHANWQEISLCQIHKSHRLARWLLQEVFPKCQIGLLHRWQQLCFTEVPVVRKTRNQQNNKQQRTCPKIRVNFESKRCFSRMVDSLKHICHIISSVWIPISIKVPESHDEQIQCHSPSSKVPILPADLSPCFPGSP